MHRRFKALCAERGETMEETVRRLIAEELARAGRTPEKGGGRK